MAPPAHEVGPADRPAREHHQGESRLRGQHVRCIPSIAGFIYIIVIMERGTKSSGSRTGTQVLEAGPGHSDHRLAQEPVAPKHFKRRPNAGAEQCALSSGQLALSWEQGSLEAGASCERLPGGLVADSEFSISPCGDAPSRNRKIPLALRSRRRRSCDRLREPGKPLPPSAC
jgi:hypothetical protein